MSSSPFPRGVRLWILGFVVTTVAGLLAFSYQYTDVLVRGATEPIHTKLIEELTGWWGALVIVPIIVWTTRRVRGRQVPVALGVHIATALTTSAIHTSWNWGSRVALFRLLGHGDYDYGLMRLRFLMELPNDIIWYVVTVSAVFLLDHFVAARARELRFVQVESELSKLRLQSLEAQLQPHFLFNALNTVSSVMYEDVAAADAILTRLGDLLRRTLRRQGVAEVALGEEIETLQLYGDILHARFADRLDLRIDVAPDAARAIVPQLLLQPLVENAVKHGDPGPGQRARIAVRAARNNGSLVVHVEDNGPGWREGATAGEGVGLENTRRRLEQLYGDRQSLALTRGGEGGLHVVIEIPWREASNAADA